MGVDVVLGSDDKWENEVKIRKEKGKIRYISEDDSLLKGSKHW